MSRYSDTLDAYLGAPGQTESALAAIIGKTQPTVHRYRRGARLPDADTARLLESATKGQVSFELWRQAAMEKIGATT